MKVGTLNPTDYSQKIIVRSESQLSIDTNLATLYLGGSTLLLLEDDNNFTSYDVNIYCFKIFTLRTEKW